MPSKSSSTAGEPTPHRSRRRRREPKKPATDASDKENSVPATSKVESSFDVEKNGVGHSDGDTPSHIQNILRSFRAASQSTSSRSFWKKHSSLAECIVNSSVLFSDGESIQESALLLEGRAADVFQICRTAVKAATEGDNIDDNLLVAIHGIRGILSQLIDSKELEAAIKVLYYAVKTATDRCLTSKEKTSCLESAALCLGALQAMGRVFTLYSIPLTKGKGCVRFSCTQHTVLSFPVPVIRQSQGAIGSIPIKQLFKIGIQSITDAASCVSRLTSIRFEEASDSSRDFGQGVSDILTSAIVQDNQLFETCLSVIRDNAQPWMSVLASRDVATDETLVDVLAYAKRVHGILLDAAVFVDKRLKKVSCGKNKSEWTARSLLLREQAIVSLVLSNDSDMPPSRTLQEALQKGTFDTACACAWRASALYVQQRASDELGDQLWAFHARVGRALDAIAVDSCTSYAEYCVYRALHCKRHGRFSCSCESTNCIFPYLPFQYVHRQCLPVSSHRPKSMQSKEQGAEVLALTFVLLSLREELDRIIGHSSQQNAIEGGRLGEVLKACQICLRGFRRVSLQESSHALPLDLMVRYQKLVELSSIDRKIFEFLSQKEDLTLTDSDVALLEAAGAILVDCTGPFVASIYRKSTTRKPQYCAMAMESFIRGMQLFDFLHIHSRSRHSTGGVDADTRLLGMADQSMRRLSEFVSKGRASRADTERAAKAISAIGRKRFDRMNHVQSLLPTFLSTRLFSGLSEEVESSQNYQVPMRCAHLASIFQRLGMHGEASLAFVLATEHETRDAAKVNQVAESEVLLDLLERIGGLSNGLVCIGAKGGPPRSRQPAVSKRLVRAYWENRNASGIAMSVIQFVNSATFDLWDGMEESITSIPGGVTDEKNSDDEGKVVNLGELLRAAFTLQTRPYGDRRRNKYLLAEQVCVTCQIISSISALESFQPEGAQEIIELFRLLTQTSNRLIDSSDGASRDLIVATAHLAAAVSLAAPRSQERGCGQHPGYEQLHARALCLNEKAQQLLKGMDDDKIKPLAMAVLVSAKIQSYQIKQVSRESDLASIFSSCHVAVKALNELNDFVGTSVNASTAACLVGALTILRNQLSSSGDALHSAQAALIMLQVVQTRGSRSDNRYRSMAASDLWSSRLQLLAKEVVGDTLDTRPIIQKAALQKSINELLLLELRATQLLLDMQVCTGSSVRQSMLEVRNIEQCCVESSCGDITDLLLQWVRATCALALAQGSKRVESLFSAQNYVRQCLCICRDAIAELQPRRGPTLGDCDEGFTTALASTLEEQFSARVLECLRARSLLFAAMGRHRNADAHALAMLEGQMGTERLCSRWRLEEISSALNSIDFLDPKQAASFRMILSLKTMASSMETVSVALSPDQSLFRFLTDTDRDEKALTGKMESIWNLLIVCDSLYQPFARSNLMSADICKKLICRVATVLSSPRASDYLASVSAGLERRVEGFLDFENHATLRELKLLVAQFMPEYADTLTSRCTSVVESQRAPIQCRAWAYFYLALLEISSARNTGSLQRLWASCSSIYEQPDVDQKESASSASRDERSDPLGAAKFYLREALILAGPASCMLSRDILRCLALVSGPIHERQAIGVSTAALMHTSIGSTARQVKCHNHAVGDHKSSFQERSWIFDALDTTFDAMDKRNKSVQRLFSETNLRIPLDWRLISMTLCPTGDILINSLERSDKVDSVSSIESRTVCIFAGDRSDGLLQSGLYDNILNPLDKIIQRNESHLSGLDKDTIAGQFNDSSSKRDWWDERHRIDRALQSHVQLVEGEFFKAQSVKQLFACGDSQCEDEESWLKVSRGNLASKFEEVYSANDSPAKDTESTSDRLFDANDARRLTVDEIRKELIGLGIDQKRSSKMKKKDLIELLVDESRKRHMASTGGSPTAESGRPGAGASPITILILDEHLNRFPWEGMEIFKGRAVCRVPSLPFALAPLLDNDAGSPPYVDPRSARYVVDPEGNLGKTKDRLVPVAEDISTGNQWDWEGVVGTMPSPDFMEGALKKENGLLLYCGHGGGQSCFSRSKVETLMRGEQGCRASLILMGCSSGKLESVNRKDSNFIGRTPIYYEPEGIALSYLCAGSPCVVGNLWDVTDRDIDRYCVTLLETFLGDDVGNRSLAQCVADARSSCVMSHIVGLAPVCYGVPVHLLPSSKDRVKASTAT